MGWCGGRQGGCERRIEVFVKIHPKKNFGVWGGGSGCGGQGGLNEELKFLRKFAQKKIRGGGGGGGGGGWWGGGFRVEGWM